MTASTPWRVIVDQPDGDVLPLVYICDRENHVICYLPEHRWEHRPVFDMLVRCVNLQAELLDALQDMVDAWGSGHEFDESPSIDKARAVLRKAKGGHQ